MVITVTLNPCVDRTIEVEKFQYGGTNKVLMTRNDISGKGINVNLVLQHLGIENLATGFDYQEDTKKLTGFLDRLGCRYKLEPVEGSLRVNVKIFDCATSVMSEFNEAGLGSNSGECGQLFEAFIYPDGSGVSDCGGWFCSSGRSRRYL